MIVGHLATALLPYGRKVPVPLPVLLVLTQLPDLGWFVLATLGVEPTEPASFLDVSLRGLRADMLYSHSGVVDLAVAVLVGVVAGLVTKDRAAALWCGALVIGHTLCDWLSGFQHELVLRGSPMVGFGLYGTNPTLAIGIELVFTLGLVGLFVREHQPRIAPKKAAVLFGAFTMGVLFFLPTADHTLRGMLGL